ncbi:MAG: T9SS type A sorting domain-containing protein, partial [Cytophagales bacterium]|nr:T9SS type A sorting domain-containing protein [Cytophagales bacterium]
TATSAGANVQWDQVDAGGGFFYLVHQGSGNKLHSSDGLTVNTTTPSATDNNVQWSWVDAGGEWYRLEHKGSGTWLHARQDATDFRLAPTSWTGDNTRWKFANVSAPAARLASKEGEKPVEPIELDNVIIYPNPVQNILEIDGITTHSRIKIYNSSGTELLNRVGKDKIDVSSFEQGIYFLKIDNEKTIRFIKI